MGGSRGVVKVRGSLDQRLRLYESAVQHPLAEVAFFERAYAHHASKAGRADRPRTLREDFAGTAAVAEMWCRSDPRREALAVESHAPTLRWAQRRRGELDALHFVHADVLAFHGPRVDVVAALNFSVLIWHDRATLLKYFRHVRRCLAPGGVFVMDLFGGPDAASIKTQTRTSHDDLGQPIAYRWEQRAYDPATARLDARIHFGLAPGRDIHNAFVYDWRLWTVPELRDALDEAGFATTTLWSDLNHTGLPCGRYRPTRRLPGPEVAPAWVVYLTAGR